MSASIEEIIAQERISLDTGFEEDGGLKAVFDCENSNSALGVCFVSMNLMRITAFDSSSECRKIECDLQELFGWDELQKLSA